MEDLPDIDKEFLIREGNKIIHFANSNIDQLNGKCQERDTTQDYYLGILRRQTIILGDLVALLQHSPHNNFTSLFILCRCLLDDFLVNAYLKTNADEGENIVRINAKAYSESFKALGTIAKLNHMHHDGEYPFYLTNEEFEALKEHYQSKASNDKYFKDKGAFQFKAFQQLTQLAENIKNFKLSKITLRALFLWKGHSDYIHYSNLTLELEMNEVNDQIYLRDIEESMHYAFNTVEMAFRYFEEKFNLDIVMDDELEARYFMDIN